MTNKIKKYRSDHKKFKVYCPCCGKVMSGWTFEEGAITYWINHQVPGKHDKRCLASEDQMISVREKWEDKYELVEETNP